MDAQLARNPLVLKQSLESNGRKIASNSKNLRREIVFVIVSSYTKEKDSKTTMFPGCLHNRSSKRNLLDRALTPASAISDSLINDRSFPFLLFIRDS